MLFYDSADVAPNVIAVRQFIHERGHLSFDVQHVNMGLLEQRQPTFRAEVHHRGTMPALKLDDGTVLSEITALCELLDELAEGGASLIGGTVQERAKTRMAMRRVDLEVMQPSIEWWRGSEDAEAMYRGHRVLNAEGRRANRFAAETGLNNLEIDMQDGRPFITGDSVTMVDILLFAFLSAMEGGIPFLNFAGRRSVAAWWDRMEKRESTAKSREPFEPRRVTV